MVGKPGVGPETIRRKKDAIHDAGDPERVREGRAGRHAGRQACSCDDEVQRIPAEGRGAARARWPAPAVDGRARLVLRRETHGDRRTFHRSEGNRRRLLDDPGEVQGRGGRMGEALSRFGQRSDRDSPGAGVRGFPCRCPEARARRARAARAAQAAAGIVMPQLYQRSTKLMLHVSISRNAVRRDYRGRGFSGLSFTGFVAWEIATVLQGAAPNSKQGENSMKFLSIYKSAERN